MKADFSGYATKANLKCADGLVIMPGAFAHQDGQKVPLVYQHVHGDAEQVVGHAILHARPDGMYADAYFNNTKKGQHAKEMVRHGDVDSLSIYANRLVREAEKVMHGIIREVSLVLAGMNPGAKIDFVSINHGGYLEDLETDAVIYTGEMIVRHSDEGEAASHADGEEDAGDGSASTVEDVYNTMTDEQKTVVHYMLAKALEGDTGDEGGDTAQQGETLEQDDTKEDPSTTEDKTDMGNLFEDNKGATGGTPTTLTHSDMKEIFETAAADEISTKKAIEAYAIAHGIVNIEALFPEAKALTTTPTWDKRRTEWVAGVFGRTTKSPFSRIKTWTADITYDEARALGYVKGDLKKEEWFTHSSRVTTPKTIYKKQSIDRDDMLDITDFDVVAWKKVEMRFMLEEEISRAILLGDGRAVDDENKIDEDKIRPIISDHTYYTKQVGVDTAGTDANADVIAVVDAVVASRYLYKGSGNPTFYTTEEWLGVALTVRDTLGHRLFKTVGDLAAEMRVSDIVTVPVLNSVTGCVGILVNMSDYVVGADKGGQVTMFDDFDIDYNKYKYLMETRFSGALTLPSSAIVYYSDSAAGKTIRTPTAPTWDPETGEITIPTVTGVTYVNQDGVTKTGTVTLTAGTATTIFAIPAASTDVLKAGMNQWSYLVPPA